MIWFRGERIKWDLHEIAEACVVPAAIVDDVDTLIKQLVSAKPQPNDRRQHWVIMSNGDFGGIYQQLTEALADSAN